MPPRRRPLVTDRDRAVLAFLAEHRALVESQVQLLLGVSARAAGERLRALDAGGLVRYERIFEGLPATVSITRRGLDAIGSQLPAPRVDLKGHRHDVGVGWLWLAAQDGAFGQVKEVVSEREMRSRDRRTDRAGPRFGIGFGAGERHYPDLLVSLADGRTVAIELELTAKSQRRLDRIMLGYAGESRIDAVLYLVPPGSVGRRIEAAARRAGLGDLVHVQRLAAGSPAGTVEPGRASTRSAARPAERGQGRSGVSR